MPVSKHCKFPETCARTGQCEHWLRHLEGCEVPEHRTGGSATKGGNMRTEEEIRAKIQESQDLMVELGEEGRGLDDPEVSSLESFIDGLLYALGEAGG